MTDPDRIAAFLRALGQNVPPASVAAVVDLLCGGRPFKARPAIPLVLWRDGRQVSAPGAWVTDPPPAILKVQRPRLFTTLDALVDHMIEQVMSEPEVESYVLQYVRQEPRAAVYLYAPEALKQMERA